MNKHNDNITSKFKKNIYLNFYNKIQKVKYMIDDVIAKGMESTSDV